MRPASVTVRHAAAGSTWVSEGRQSRRLERARPAERVERVLQVVGAGRHVDPGRRSALTAVTPRGIACGCRGPGGTGWWRERDDGDPSRGDDLGDLALAWLGCMPRLTQWLAVTGRSNPVSHDTVGQLDSPRHPGRASRRCAGRRRRRGRRRCSSSASVAARAGASSSRWGQPPTRSAPAPGPRRAGPAVRPRTSRHRPAAQGDDLARRSRRRPGRAASRAPRCCVSPWSG